MKHICTINRLTTKTHKFSDKKEQGYLDKYKKGVLIFKSYIYGQITRLMRLEIRHK